MIATRKKSSFCLHFRLLAAFPWARLLAREGISLPLTYTLRMKPKWTPETRKARLMAALNAAYIHPYRSESCDSTCDAQRNLQGRTHYVDPATLKGFEARILASGIEADGLLYWIVESVNSRPDHGGYTRRGIVFDIFGTIVNERADMAETQGEWFRDTAKAEKSVAEFITGFDAVQYTADTLAHTARRDIETAKATLAILAGKTLS